MGEVMLLTGTEAAERETKEASRATRLASIISKELMNVKLRFTRSFIAAKNERISKKTKMTKSLLIVTAAQVQGPFH